MSVCNYHAKNPARIYGPCVGCELERLRSEIEQLRAPDPRVEKLVEALEYCLSVFEKQKISGGKIAEARAALAEWKEGREG